MQLTEFAADRRFVDTDAGRIAYVERGAGPVALFFHAAFFNGCQWRDVVERTAGARRCIVYDILGHGHTEARAGQPLDFAAQSTAAIALLDALGVDRADLVGGDSGGAIAQVLAATRPERVRTLCLTNTDVYTNSPPPVFAPVIDRFRARGAAAIVSQLLASPESARSRTGFGLTYEDPATLTDELLEAYLRPLISSPDRADAFQRFILSLSAPHLVEIAPALRRLEAPTLIAWGAADAVFDVRWAYWLAGAIPGAGPVVEVEGARTFWMEERPDVLADLLLRHWSAASPLPA